MKRFLSKTIILILITAIFLAPFSANLELNKKNNLALNIETKKAEAQQTTQGCDTTTPCVNLEAVNINRNSVKFNVKIINIKGIFPSDESVSIQLKLTGKNSESIEILSEGMSFTIKDQDAEETETKTFCIGQEGCDSEDSKVLSANTGYTLITGIGSTISKFTFDTAVEGSGQEGSASGLRVTNKNDVEFGCTSLFNFSLSACVMQLVSGISYIVNLLIKLTAFILDFFIYYATNSDSYKNEFIQEGWGAVRDIANIFFIVALLYVAIKTILGLNVTDNKKLIGTVILIALVINFSLFTTKVVIDGSNILAKVFYNNVTGKDANGKTITEKNGQKSISIGIVQAFQPQNLITQDFYDKNEWTSIFIILISICVMFYTGYIFLSVSLLFVARVISLWLSMIFSPIAFASYTVPFDIPGFGHKEWWKNLFENAMLAPLFVFFLYIIIKFTGFLSKSFVNTDSGSLDTLFNSMMKIIIPFIIIIMLLKKGKDLAVKYSGEMGAAVMTGAKMIGGLALGAATGGAALIGTKTIGRTALNLANDDNLRAQASGDKEHFAKMGINDEATQRKMQIAAQKKLASANKWASKSFDFRQTGLGKNFSKISGMDLSKGLGNKATQSEQLKGGAKAKEKRDTQKEEERIESYKMTAGAAREQDQKASIAKKQNDRAEQYEKDKEEARAYIESKWGMKFNEEEFKNEYIKGGKIAMLGNKTVDGGEVDRVDKIKTSSEVNDERRIAYANSLEKNNEKAKDAMGVFWSEFKKGTGVSTGKGIAATIAAGIATGGVSTFAQVGTGLARGITKSLRAGIANELEKTEKDLNEHEEPLKTYLSALKETLRPYSISPEIVAKIRKENPNKWLEKTLNDIINNKHVSEKDKSKATEKIKNLGH